MNDLSLLDTFFGNAPAFYGNSANRLPCVDVIETKDTYEFSMELPGRCEKDVEISLKEDVLTIASIKGEEENKKTDGNYLIKERKFNEFKRTFSLPKDIDTEKVSACFKHGILSISIGKKPQAAEKKIAIKIA